MPADLHVVSMKPEYTKTNDLVLHIVVATDSRDRAVELYATWEIQPLPAGASGRRDCCGK